MWRLSGKFYNNDSSLLCQELYTNSYVENARYALTLRIMLANLRRKMGMVPPGVMQNPQPPMEVPAFMDPSLVAPPPPPPPFTREELGGMAWPTADERMFSPSAIPVWSQEQVRW